MKQFCMDEAASLGVHVRTIWNRIRRGNYPNLKLRRVNRRVVFVTDARHALRKGDGK